MKTDAISPLEGVACCQNVPEYHPPCAAGEAGMPHPGDILDDRFLLTEVISRSGMAMIYKAQDLHNDSSDVAVKVPYAKHENDAGFIRRFRREEEIGLKLNHPFIIKFIPAAAPKSRPYIVTEYLRGCTLAHLLDAMAPLPEKDVLKIGSLLCEALQYLHDCGIIHRDLKPHNVMVGCNGAIRLLDFGLAESSAPGRAAPAGFSQAMGTPDYMAPEQVEGKRCDERTDIYCLGTMLYEMLTGRPPFEGDNSLAVMTARVLGDPEPLRRLNPAVSQQVEKIVLHAMKRAPARRLRSARVLRAKLDKTTEGHAYIGGVMSLWASLLSALSNAVA